MRAAVLIVMAAMLSIPLLAEKPARVTKWPVPIHKPEPEYTEEAREAKIQGSVQLTGVIGIDGRFTGIRVRKSLGYGLEEKAIECVRKWRWKPALRDDEPAPVKATVEVNFRIL